MQVQQAQQDLERAIAQAIADPGSANMHQFLQRLEQLLVHLPQASQLQVAGTILTQLVELYFSRANRSLEEWEEKYNPVQDEPVLTTELLHEVLRQTMNLNLDEVLDDPTLDPQRPEPSESLAGTVDKSNLLEFLAQLNEEQARQDALLIAHDENISAWIEAISHWLNEHPVQYVSLLELQQSLQMPFIEIWLGLLLGGFALEQRGDFYETDGVWIQAQKTQKYLTEALNPFSCKVSPIRGMRVKGTP